jgi:outer membrane protein TolC
LLAYDKYLYILDKTLQTRIKDLETMKVLKEASVVNGTTVVQNEANRYAAEVGIPDIKRNVRNTENAIDILLGHPPGIVTGAVTDDQKHVAEPQTGAPAQLLKN